MALLKAKELVSSNSVVVFSKTYCPYCTTVKQLLQQVGASFKAVELDTESDGAEIQKALGELSGQRTVPNVFIGGKHIGGCDSDGVEIQKALGELSGQRTVPNVFIGGKHIGGCDTTTAMHKKGDLVPLLTEAGAVAKTSA